MIIEQKPLYNTLPVGQDIVFTVSDETIIVNKFQTKFTAEVHVSSRVSNLGLTDSIVANLKVTPNLLRGSETLLKSLLDKLLSPINLIG